jgi:dTDP-4-amino-4,6-dideoxy-D-glucose acyltransferase
MHVAASIGYRVKISQHAVLKRTPIYRGRQIQIDDGVWSGRNIKLIIWDHVHISFDVKFLGHGEVELKPFSGLSPGVLVMTSTDDFSGEHLTGPTVKDKLVKLDSRRIMIGRHVVVGARSVILPGVTIGDYAAIGAMSLVRRDVPAGEIWGGNPLRFIRKRNGERLKELENA